MGTDHQITQHQTSRNIAQTITRMPLFAHIGPDSVDAMLTCFGARTATFASGEFIERAGSETTQVGIVVAGAVEVIDEDFWGNRNIHEHITAPGMFGAAYACVPGSRMRVSVVATKPSTIAFLDLAKVATPCSNACAFHAQLTRNLLASMARKNLQLTERMTYASQRSTRDKLLAYLSDQAVKHQSASFDIPLDRQQLADFLSVNRSAMSSELSALRREGIIEFRKNHFELKRDIGR